MRKSNAGRNSKERQGNNLIPNNERSPEELREMGRKGGIASGRARRRKRDGILFVKIFMEEIDKLEKKDKDQVKRVTDRLIREIMKRG